MHSHSRALLHVLVRTYPQRTMQQSMLQLQSLLWSVKCEVPGPSLRYVFI